MIKLSLHSVRGNKNVSLSVKNVSWCLKVHTKQHSEFSECSPCCSITADPRADQEQCCRKLNNFNLSVYLIVENVNTRDNANNCWQESIKTGHW